MQHQLRELLEDKVARGGYYFDMGQGYDEGELVAGKRKRKAPKRKKETKDQLKARMAKVRAGIPHKRGGDFVDLNDAMYGAGKRKAQAKSYRNPIEKAMRDNYKLQHNDEWLMTHGAEYASKLKEKADAITNALTQTRTGALATAYNNAYRDAYNNFRQYAPAQKAASKAGVKFIPPTYARNGAVLDPYELALLNARAGIRGIREYPGLPRPGRAARVAVGAVGDVGYVPAEEEIAEILREDWH